MSDLHELRLDHLETDVREIKEALKTPTRGFIWGVRAALTGAYTAALAAAALIVALPLPVLSASQPTKPTALRIADDRREVAYSCRQLHAEQKKCAFGSCDKRVIDRLTKECLRDGGRP